MTAAAVEVVAMYSAAMEAAEMVDMSLVDVVIRVCTTVTKAMMAAVVAVAMLDTVLVHKGERDPPNPNTALCAWTTDLLLLPLLYGTRNVLVFLQLVCLVTAAKSLTLSGEDSTRKVCRPRWIMWSATAAQCSSMVKVIR